MLPPMQILGKRCLERGHLRCAVCRYDNWVAAMVDWKKAESSEQWHSWVQQAFQAFDVDGSGSIGIQDLQNMLCGELCAVS